MISGTGELIQLRTGIKCPRSIIIPLVLEWDTPLAFRWAFYRTTKASTRTYGSVRLCGIRRIVASRMRMKIRYVLTALVLLWLVISLVYLFPFLLAPREKPSVVSVSQCAWTFSVTAGRTRSRLEQCTTQHDENNSVYVRVCTPLEAVARVRCD